MLKEKKYGKKEINKMISPKNWEIWDAPKSETVMYQYFPEFTCLCPRSGYPDFAKVHIVSIPSKKVLELKSLKLWLNSFREKGISHENTTNFIADTLMDELKLKYIFVLMEYSPRGNLDTFPMTERGNIQYRNKEEIKQMKRNLIDKIM